MCNIISVNKRVSISKKIHFLLFIFFVVSLVFIMRVEYTEEGKKVSEWFFKKLVTQNKDFLDAYFEKRIPEKLDCGASVIYLFAKLHSGDTKIPLEMMQFIEKKEVVEDDFARLLVAFGYARVPTQEENDPHFHTLHHLLCLQDVAIERKGDCVYEIGFELKDEKYWFIVAICKHQMDVLSSTSFSLCTKLNIRANVLEIKTFCAGGVFVNGHDIIFYNGKLKCENKEIHIGDEVAEVCVKLFGVLSFMFSRMAST